MRRAEATILVCTMHGFLDDAGLPINTWYSTYQNHIWLYGRFCERTCLRNKWIFHIYWLDLTQRDVRKAQSIHADEHKDNCELCANNWKLRICRFGFSYISTPFVCSLIFKRSADTSKSYAKKKTSFNCAYSSAAIDLLCHSSFDWNKMVFNWYTTYIYIMLNMFMCATASCLDIAKICVDREQRQLLNVISVTSSRRVITNYCVATTSTTNIQ